MIINFHSFLNLPLSLLLCILFISGSVHAIEVKHSSQEDITLVLERGSTFEFPLFLEDILEEDVEDDLILRADGDIEDWVSFIRGGEREETYSIGEPSDDRTIIVSIKVPRKAELGERKGSIDANSMELVDLNIKVTIELNNAEAYEKLADVDQEVGTLRNEVESLTDSLTKMGGQIDSLEDDVSGKMEDIYQYQKDLKILEDQNKKITDDNKNLAQDLESFKEKSEELEDENTELNELTGMLVGTQIPGMFFIGIVLGIIVVTTVVKRAHIGKKFKDRFQKSPAKKDNGYRYSYRP